MCKEYPALTPWDIDDKSFHDVIKLYGEVRTMQISASKVIENVNNPNRVIRRPAGDNWF